MTGFRVAGGQVFTIACALYIWAAVRRWAVASFGAALTLSLLAVALPLRFGEKRRVYIHINVHIDIYILFVKI